MRRGSASRCDSERKSPREFPSRAQATHEAQLERMVPDPQRELILNALLGQAGQVLESLNQLTQVAIVQFEFEDARAMRASACGLIKRAALKRDTPEALDEAAHEILTIMNADRSRK